MRKIICYIITLCTIPVIFMGCQNTNTPSNQQEEKTSDTESKEKAQIDFINISENIIGQKYSLSFLTAAADDDFSAAKGNWHAYDDGFFIVDKYTEPRLSRIGSYKGGQETDTTVYSSVLNYEYSTLYKTTVDNQTQNAFFCDFPIFSIDTGEKIRIDEYCEMLVENEDGEEESVPAKKGTFSINDKDITIIRYEAVHMKFTPEMMKDSTSSVFNNMKEDEVVDAFAYNLAVHYPEDFDFDTFKGFAIGTAASVPETNDYFDFFRVFDSNIYSLNKDDLKYIRFFGFK